jgi:spore coat assembly protein SafA
MPVVQNSGIPINRNSVRGIAHSPRTAPRRIQERSRPRFLFRAGRITKSLLLIAATALLLGSMFDLLYRVVCVPSQGSLSIDPLISEQRYVKVEEGDTVWGIASKYGVSVSTLQAANPQSLKNPHRIYPGQRLCIPARNP